MLANYIHDRNHQIPVPEVTINLKGLLIESPWIDPYHQVDYGTYLLNLGLIEESNKEEFDMKRDNMMQLMSEGDYEGAFGVLILSTLLPITITLKLCRN